MRATWRLRIGNGEAMALRFPDGSRSYDTTQRAAAKEERARDAALAMQEYEAEKRAVDVKTARLRALRLAKEPETNKRTKRKNLGTRTTALLRA